MHVLEQTKRRKVKPQHKIYTMLDSLFFGEWSNLYNTCMKPKGAQGIDCYHKTYIIIKFCLDYFKMCNSYKEFSYAILGIQ